jgi:hypothetical protein
MFKLFERVERWNRLILLRRRVIFGKDSGKVVNRVWGLLDIREKIGIFRYLAYTRLNGSSLRDFWWKK